MKFIPILFSSPMVQGVQLNFKTQTRRTRGLNFINRSPDEWKFVKLSLTANGELLALFKHVLDGGLCSVKCPYGNIGDVLWVRENFQYRLFDKNQVAYAADFNEPLLSKIIWKPSIHMPKTACRIFLQITDIRVERLQNITEEDAIAEGVKLSDSGKFYLNYVDEKHKITQFIYNCSKAKDSFRTLWYLINGKRDEPFAWFKNPFVWVISFKQIPQPAEFLN